MTNNFTITGFSDEIDSDILTQFENISRLGMHYYEPRVVNGKNIINLNDEEVGELSVIMDNYGIAASSIGSPIGKIKTTDDFDTHFESFKRTVEIANKLNTKYIRMFSFFMPENERPEDYTDFVVERLSKMVDYASKNNVVLLHENEKGIYGNIAVRCKTLFEKIVSPNFRAVFDFSNFVECSQETLEAYEMLKPYIEYIHVKDCKNGGGVVPAGRGDGNVEAILKKLNESGFKGFASIEPHLTGYAVTPEEGEFVNSFATDNAKRFALAHQSLVKILERI